MIFETMNDRGLSLTPTDMLKGYLLAYITDEEKRDDAANIWKVQSHELKEISTEETSDFLKAWLRSQYAQSIRERKKNAKPRDFDRLGTEFHRWVRDHKDIVQEKENLKVGIGLNTSDDFYGFIKNDFTFYWSAICNLTQCFIRILAWIGGCLPCGPIRTDLTISSNSCSSQA